MKKITIRTENRIHFLDVDDIIRCESESNYTRIYLLHGASIIVGKTLKYYDELLNRVGFFRIHRSHLINISHIIHFERSESTLILKDNSRIPVATRKRGELLNFIEKG